MSGQENNSHTASEVIWQNDHHKFVWLGIGDPAQEKGISSNQYLVVDQSEGYVLDPGGYNVFDRVFENIAEFTSYDQLKGLFISHQDPDICVSLISWLEVQPDIEVIVSGLWERFIPHLALPVSPKMKPLPDEGGEVKLLSGSVLRFVPAHFLHSPGNFHVYDEASKILFTGDLGAALVPEDKWSLFVGDFEAHIPYMEGFHRRYMSSNKALRNYIDYVRTLEIEMICPQHGTIFKGENVKKFMDWLYGLDVGVDYKNWGRE